MSELRIECCTESIALHEDRLLTDNIKFGYRQRENFENKNAYHRDGAKGNETIINSPSANRTT